MSSNNFVSEVTTSKGEKISSKHMDHVGDAILGTDSLFIVSQFARVFSSTMNLLLVQTLLTLSTPPLVKSLLLFKLVRANLLSDVETVRYSGSESWICNWCLLAEEEQVNAAVDAAEKAYRDVWSKTTGRERARLMNKLADLIEEHVDELAKIETLDNGKGIAFSKGFDVPEVAKTLRYFAGYADKIHGKVMETQGKLSYTRHEPIGVCGAIIPWNFPIMMLGWKIGPALCTGNTIVVKTSELTPLSAFKLGEYVKEAGFPPGVLNIITGYGAIAGDKLARHPKVGKIAFTGSTAVGRMIMKAAAESNLKKVTLELGGKSPNIIFDDADLDQAVAWAHKGIFFNHGQVCCAGSRIYVQGNISLSFISPLLYVVYWNLAWFHRGYLW